MSDQTANVKVTWKQDEQPSVIVDGVEMATKIKADTLEVRFPQEGDGGYGQPEVTFTLIADVEIDADSLVEVSRG